MAWKSSHESPSGTYMGMNGNFCSSNLQLSHRNFLNDRTATLEISAMYTNVSETLELEML
eukprot:2233091-Amphidinium_carterae.1